MRIVITGAGIISALGIGKQTTLQALLAEQSGIQPIHYLNTTHKEMPAGEVKYSNSELKAIVGIPATEPISRTSLLGIVAAKEALEQSKISDCRDMAFISGTTVGGMDITEQYWLGQIGLSSGDIAQLHSAGSSTKQIAKHIGDFAYQTTPSTACSSALNAIITGANLIRCGKTECALVGGAESLTLFHFNGFRSLQILDSEPCRPFCETRNGLNLGEGAAYIVIETEESALKRGANILAYLNGYANSCDAYHQTASSPDGQGAYHAMKEALEMSCYSTQDIDYINAHGTATPNNDASESNAINSLFGNQTPAVSSTKAFTGHTTSASGSIETVISLLAMQNDFIPASLNIKQPMSDGVRAVQHTTNKQLKHILCNSFGFGGNDSSILISSPQELPTEYQTILHSEQEIKTLQTITLNEDAADWKDYLSPMEARRLTPALKRIVVAAKKAIKLSGLNSVDAIITSTYWGCIHNSVLLLNQLKDEGEDSLKPTYFMQSTHNTPSSVVAIQLGCKKYNCTYSHDEQSYDDALLDATMQLQLGSIKSALVLDFEEEDSLWQSTICPAMPTTIRATLLSIE